MTTSSKQIKSAAEARHRIALTFNALHEGRLSPEDVLESPPACLNRIRIYDVLRRFPHMGRDGADKLLRKAVIWPTTSLGELTLKERRAIVARLPDRVFRSPS